MHYGAMPVNWNQGYGESEAVYKETWTVWTQAFTGFLRDFKPCPMKDCDCCRRFDQLVVDNEDERMLALKSTWVVRPDMLASDNAAGFQAWVETEFGPDMRYLTCAVHLTGKCMYPRLYLA